MQDTVLVDCDKDTYRCVSFRFICVVKISVFYFQPAPNQVTFHLPLHRYFAMFLSKVSTCFQLHRRWKIPVECDYSVQSVLAFVSRLSSAKN